MACGLPLALAVGHRSPRPRCNGRAVFSTRKNMNLNALIPPIPTKDGFEPNKAWVPLFIKGIIANTDEEIRANSEAALERDYITFNELIGTKSGGGCPR